jgi:hypothetical protein
VTEASHQLEPATARRIFIWQMAFFAVLLTLSAVSNTYTVVDDHARVGDQLQTWRPAVWEGSSHLLVWCLIPFIGWWLGCFPVTRGSSWWRSLPAHILATLPFSFLHVGGMVLVRKLAYRMVGEAYDFGPFWANWPYEYRKDFITYWLILAGLLAFHFYGLWLDSRERAAGAADTQAEGTPLERLVVRKLNREFILNIQDIERIEADGNYVSLYVQGSVYPLRESLVTLEKKLDQKRFARVHRGHIVNIDQIREIQPWDHGDYRIVLKDGSFVNFSRRYRSRLNHLFH